MKPKTTESDDKIYIDNILTQVLSLEKDTIKLIEEELNN